MGTGTKIGLVVCLFFVVIVIVRQISDDIDTPKDEYGSIGQAQDPSQDPVDPVRKEGLGKSDPNPGSQNPADPSTELARAEDPESGFRRVEDEDLGGSGFDPDGGSRVEPWGGDPLDPTGGSEMASAQPAVGPDAGDPTGSGFSTDGSDEVRPAGVKNSGENGDPTTEIPDPLGLDRSVADDSESGGEPGSSGPISVPPTRDPEPAVQSGGGDSRFPRQYIVLENDRLWNIAEKMYGDGSLFKEIVKANPGIGDGSTLRIGQKLTLPKVAIKPRTVAAGTSSAGTAQDGRYTVRKGDNLYRIAEKLLGSGTRWTEIQRANPGLSPETLSVGQKIKIPPK